MERNILNKNKVIKEKNKGFVLLYSMMLSAVLLTITLSVLNISLREIKFSTSGKETNDAFFAADTGAECALYYDRPDIDRFVPPTNDPNVPLNCSRDIPLSNGSNNLWNYSFQITDLGSDGNGCAKVQVLKDRNGPLIKTTITSKGYNNGGSSCIFDDFSVERLIKLTYEL
ncbi:MAG: pilus assembly PilX N-terminal domain-containing protein [Patescibacteria group bacterium]